MCSPAAYKHAGLKLGFAEQRMRISAYRERKGKSMPNSLLSEEEAFENAAVLLEAARMAANEEQFKIRAEGILERLCADRGIFWDPYTYERSFNSGSKRLDAVHGTTVIEYESPRSFNHSENA